MLCLLILALSFRLMLKNSPPNSHRSTVERQWICLFGLASKKAICSLIGNGGPSAKKSIALVSHYYRVSLGLGGNLLKTNTFDSRNWNEPKERSNKQPFIHGWVSLDKSSKRTTDFSFNCFGLMLSWRAKSSHSFSWGTLLSEELLLDDDDVFFLFFFFFFLSFFLLSGFGSLEFKMSCAIFTWHSCMGTGHHRLDWLNTRQISKPSHNHWIIALVCNTRTFFYI